MLQVSDGLIARVVHCEFYYLLNGRNATLRRPSRPAKMPSDNPKKQTFTRTRVLEANFMVAMLQQSVLYLSNSRIIITSAYLEL